ncbi:MAG: hypothetical protein HY554_19515 [Elusimicrobia bacterium]|nr:hypothetical protein [Elusimicrobiota bacterium]
MTRFAAWAVAAALAAAAAILLLQRARAPELPASTEAAPGRSPFPPVPAGSGVAQWSCPAEPARWFDGQARAEVIETPERWRQYLALSGFQPPSPVDLARVRVAFVPFLGGGNRALESVSPVAGEGRFEVVVRVRDLPMPDRSVPQDIRYECRLVAVPRDAGPLAIRFETAAPEP